MIVENHDDIYYRKVIKLGSETYSACALAKLNISLKIGRKERSGFHKLSSVMQTVSLHDRITLTKVDKETMQRIKDVKESIEKLFLEYYKKRIRITN